MLSDFLGCTSVYHKGYRNLFDFDSEESELWLANGRALCELALEPTLEEVSRLSVSYGYISNELSRKIVTYQNPDIASHHQWNLGAAADICPHDWYGEDPGDADHKSPIAFAIDLDTRDVPYSRLITYSESPFVCVAVSAEEVENGKPRRAFYENRYKGERGAPPKHYKHMSPRQREDLRFSLAAGTALEHGWQGAGYPTYHGKGIRQPQHIRAGKYTMLSDWLYIPEYVANGTMNRFPLESEDVGDALIATAYVYDRILEESGIRRLSIVRGYDRVRKVWTRDRSTFDVTLPDVPNADGRFTRAIPEGVACTPLEDGSYQLAVPVQDILAEMEAL